MYESTIMIVRMIIDGQILVCAKTHTVYPGIYQYRGISGIYRTNFKPESKLKPEGQDDVVDVTSSSYKSHTHTPPAHQPTSTTAKHLKLRHYARHHHRRRRHGADMVCETKT